jgi:hypothetical protein
MPILKFTPEEKERLLRICDKNAQLLSNIIIPTGPVLNLEMRMGISLANTAKEYFEEAAARG